MTDDLDRCENQLGENPTEENIARFQALQAKLDEHEMEKGRLAMIRSGARWLEFGERNSRYFCRLNARRNKEKHIHVLQSAEGDYVTGNK